MSVLNLYQQQVEKEDSNWRKLFPARSENLSLLKAKQFCDVLVVGGGVQGLMFARLAALHGLRTVLLEKSDYGSGASGRAPCLLHSFGNYSGRAGTLAAVKRMRKLKDLSTVAPHLLKPVRFEHNHCGVWTYISCSAACLLAALTPGVSTASHAYTLDQSLLLNESLIAARQEGALCLNYVGVESVQSLNDGSLQIGWHDYRGQTNAELRAGVVVNCTGVAVGKLGRLSKSALDAKLRYARVVTLLFEASWKAPAQVRKLFARGGSYCVFPFGAHTVVSLLSAECAEVKADLMPREEELERALLAIERDFFQQGLSRKSLFHASVAIKPLLNGTGPIHANYPGSNAVWTEHDGTLSLLAGDLPEILDVAQDGFAKLAHLTSFRDKLALLKGRMLPGAAKLESNVSRFCSEANRLGVSAEITERLADRYGSCLRFFLSSENRNFELLSGRLLKAEIDFAIEILQVHSFKDLMRRGLGLEYLPGHGLDSAAEISKYFQQLGATQNVEREVMEYRGYIEKLKQLIASTA